MRFPGVLALTIAACLAAPAAVRAQSERFEVGAQFSTLRLSGIDATDTGLGGWATWNITDAVAMEAAGEIFPGGKGNVVRGGRKFQALVGPKIVWRASRMGIFGKGRAGVARVGEGRAEGVCIAIFPPPEGCYGGDTRLAFDLGGGVELYPSPRTSIRLDIGALLTRLGESSVRFAGSDDFARDLHVAAGVGMRF